MGFPPLPGGEGRSTLDRYATRPGFTLIEVLVVVSIVGLLIALLLPAVQSAREAARRAQCANNLKQLGVALHNYQSAHGSFPLNWMEGRRDPVRGGPWVISDRPFSALTRILPYIEQTQVHDKYRPDHPYGIWETTENPTTFFPTDCPFCKESAKAI